uniref:Capsid n=1 Tax=Minke whale astrovirus 2 TaxID=943161 RepID=F1D810_9VIRU|nr:capsid precursor [Minke whale astrovirus 2]
MNSWKAFGGEDQMNAMAGDSGKVVVEVKSNNAPQPKKKRQRKRRNPGGARAAGNSDSNPRKSRRGNRRRDKQNGGQVRAAVERMGLRGPKPALSQTLSSTLGTIGPNASSVLETEGVFHLNPALASEKSGSVAFGPLQALAAQYSMWRCTYAKFIFTPLVGQSAVSGTAFRVSVNMNGNPSATNWSGLGARKHLDVHIGRRAVFHLSARDLAGPRESYWLTDTNEDGDTSLGPSVEVHSLGTTVNAFKDGAFVGDLFLLELTCRWEFANYQANPGLAVLKSGEGEVTDVTFSTNEDGELEMAVPEDTPLAVMHSRAEMRSETKPSVGEVITQVVDVAVEAGASFTGPFGWLLKGGWFFIKKIFGLGTVYVRGKKVTKFLVFPTYDAAQAGRTIKTGLANYSEDSMQYRKADFHWQQMNAPSTGPGEPAHFMLPVQPPCPEPPTPPELEKPDGPFYLSCRAHSAAMQHESHVALVLAGTNAQLVAKIRVAHGSSSVHDTTDDHIGLVFYLANAFAHSTTGKLLEMPGWIQSVQDVVHFNGTEVGTICAATRFYQGDSSPDHHWIVNVYLIQLSKLVSLHGSWSAAHTVTVRDQSDDTSVAKLKNNTSITYTDLPANSYVLGVSWTYQYNAGGWHCRTGPYTVDDTKNAEVPVNFLTATLLYPPVDGDTLYVLGMQLNSRWPQDYGGQSAMDLIVRSPHLLLDDDEVDPPDANQVVARQAIVQALRGVGLSKQEAEHAAQQALPSQYRQKVAAVFVERIADGFTPYTAIDMAEEEAASLKQ